MQETCDLECGEREIIIKSELQLLCFFLRKRKAKKDTEINYYK